MFTQAQLPNGAMIRLCQAGGQALAKQAAYGAEKLQCGVLAQAFSTRLFNLLSTVASMHV